MNRLQEIREREAKATEGPWEFGGELGSLGTVGKVDDYGHVLTPHVCTACEKRGARCLGPTPENAAFIAHARTDIPYLLRRLEIAEGALRRYANGISVIESDGSLSVAPLIDMEVARAALEEGEELR